MGAFLEWVLHLGQGWGLAHASVQDLSSLAQLPAWDLNASTGPQFPFSPSISAGAQGGGGTAPGESQARERGRRAERGPLPSRAPSPAGLRPRCSASAGPPLPAGPGASTEPHRHCGTSAPTRPKRSTGLRCRPAPIPAPLRAPLSPGAAGPRPAASGREGPALRSALRPEPGRPGAAPPEPFPSRSGPAGSPGRASAGSPSSWRRRGLRA